MVGWGLVCHVTLWEGAGPVSVSSFLCKFLYNTPQSRGEGEGEREGGRKGGREGEREGRKEGGREEGRKEGGREGRRERGREGRKEGGREGGRGEGGREGGREEGREGERRGGRRGEGEGKTYYALLKIGNFISPITSNISPFQRLHSSSMEWLHHVILSNRM